MYLKLYFDTISNLNHNDYNLALSNLEKLNLSSIKLDDQAFVHLHDINILEDVLGNKKLLIVRRNPVEITASSLIAEQTGAYHFKVYSQDNINTTDIEWYKQKYQNQNFKLDTFTFIRKLHSVINWYIDAENFINVIKFNL